MNDNDLRDEYSRLMTEAYPKPRADIKGSVMAKIAAEEQKKKPNRAKSRQQRFVKWGSIAACFVVLCVLGFRVLPMMMNKVAMNDTADVTSQSVAEEAADQILQDELEQSAETQFKFTTDGSSPFFKSPAPASEPIEEEAEEIEPIEEAVEEAVPVENSALESLDLYDSEPEDLRSNAVITESAQDSLQGYAGGMLSSNYSHSSAPPPVNELRATECAHSGAFKNSFHDLPKSVTNLALTFISETALFNWIGSVSGTCDMNIYELIKTAGIPREAFEELYLSSDLWYHHDYNIDILYGGDDEAVYEYYQTGGSYADMVCRYFEYELKLRLLSEVGIGNYSKWAAENNYNAICKWTIPDFLTYFSISTTRISELYTALSSTFAEDYPSYAIPEYDFIK